MTGEDRQLAESLQAAKAAHFDADGAACDYAALVTSRERGRLAACLADLEKFDPKRVRIPAQTAFWVNVFNAGVLRDVPELELAAGPDEVQAFFERPRLKIGGRLYALDDVQHGLLRGNLPKNGRLRPPMLRDDPRLAYMPIAYDERIHFAMHSACRSSPPLRVFDGGQLDVQFEDASTGYVRRSVRIEAGGAVVVVPRLLGWYAEDFGGERGVLEFVLTRLEDEAAVDLVDRRRGRVKLQYAAFDWVLNRREASDGNRS